MNPDAAASSKVPVCAGPAIPQYERAGFCSAFGRVHRGGLMSVSMIDSADLLAGPQSGGVVLTRELPLESVMVVQHDREAGLGVRFRVSAEPERLDGLADAEC
jgi:hypothetical protein